MAWQDGRVPANLLTGFLQARKTKLQNHLIRVPEAARVAVVMTEFGEVGLDGDLIEETTKETTLLPSGRMRCTVLGYSAETLAALSREPRDGEISFVRIVIETTGIAVHAPIIHPLRSDRMLAQTFRLEGVVALADVATGTLTLEAQLEALSQAAISEVIILCKNDPVDTVPLGSFSKRLERTDASAPRIAARHGHVPIGTLFELSAMRQGAESTETKTRRRLASDGDKPDPLAGFSGVGAPAATPTSFNPAAVRAHAGREHNIASATSTVTEAIRAKVRKLLLDTLTSFKEHANPCMKAILPFEGLAGPFVSSEEQHIFDELVPSKDWPEEDTTSRLVVIAPDIEEANLRRSLDTLLRQQDGAKAAQTGGMMVETTEMLF